jgi:diguanylate cyclase (GGDEF)-like protein
VVLHAAIEDQRSMQRAISASGQQRMYSQRIAMFADTLASHPTAQLRTSAKGDLAKSIAIFSQTHAALTEGDPSLNPQGWPPASVKRMYFDRPFDVDAQVRAYLAHARAIERRAGQTIAADDPDLVYLLEQGPGPLLASLDAVVHVYNDEQRASVVKFEFLQLALLAAGLSTLGVIWFSMFLPMEREIIERTNAMEFQASHDPLTDLLNRRAFGERVDASLASARRRVDSSALFLIDLDDFKSINDTHGHLAGDAAIRAVSDRLAQTVRAGDLIARLGGDEFAVFAPEIDEASAITLAGRLAKTLRNDIDFGAVPIPIAASIGLAMTPDDERTLERLLAAADAALYEAKRIARGNFVRYRSLAAAPAPLIAPTNQTAATT